MEFEAIAKKVSSDLKASTDVEHTVVLLTPDQRVVALGQFLNKRLKVTIEVQDLTKKEASGLEKL